MKVLLLIIFNDDTIYNEFLLIQRSYIHRCPNIDAYFVTFNDTQTENVIMNDDIIYIKGSENYINILFKTIESLDYINKNFEHKYDFVVRSNISTIINLDNLYKYLLSSPNTNIYRGGTLETLRWLLQTYEISEKKQGNRNDYYGLKYIQGTSIIMSDDVVQYILKIKENIEYDIVDDVKLGIIIREYFPEIYKNIENENVAKVSYNNFEEDSVFIRNRCHERKLDIHRMRNIINVNINSTINPLYPNFDKIIHITNKTIDEKLLKTKKDWEDLNPEYNVKLYNDETCLEVLYKYFGQKYCDIFNFIQDGPIKSDFFRLCIIYIFGGIYVDSDIKPLISLKNYLDDDLDFMTCISYNFIKNKLIFNYNPQMIVAKKYSDIILTVIYEYESLYDRKYPYTYWSWSIYSLFKQIGPFNITANGNNTFIYKNKKYKFLIEEVLDKNTNETFNFENFSKIKNKSHNLSVYCRNMNNIVFNNFDNK